MYGENFFIIVFDLKWEPLESRDPFFNKKYFFYPHPKTFFSLLLEREEGRERNIDLREKHALVASCTRPDQGLEPKPTT